MTDDVDAGKPKPLTLEWMEASRDHWMNKAIERKERIAALEAALNEIARQSDAAIATCDGDGCLCCVTMDDINRRVDAVRTSVEDSHGE